MHKILLLFKIFPLLSFSLLFATYDKGSSFFTFNKPTSLERPVLFNPNVSPMATPRPRPVSTLAPLSTPFPLPLKREIIISPSTTLTEEEVINLLKAERGEELQNPNITKLIIQNQNITADIITFIGSSFPNLENVQLGIMPTDLISSTIILLFPNLKKLHVIGNEKSYDLKDWLNELYPYLAFHYEFYEPRPLPGAQAHSLTIEEVQAQCLALFQQAQQVRANMRMAYLSETNEGRLSSAHFRKMERDLTELQRQFASFTDMEEKPSL
jgi:hypothetical protein